MKKKGVIAAVVVLIAVAAGAYLLTRHKPLGSMRNSYSEQTTAVSDISFWEMQTKESNFHSAQTLYAETWISFCLIRLVMRYICWIRRTLWKRCSL